MYCKLLNKFHYILCTPPTTITTTPHPLTKPPIPFMNNSSYILPIPPLPLICHPSSFVSVESTKHNEETAAAY